MRNFYTADIFRYIKPGRLPLWVGYIEKGTHIERLFHNHEFSEIAIILQGSAIHIIGKESCKVSAGDILVLHPGVSHAYDQTGDMEMVNIVYDPLTLSLPVLDGYALPMFHKFFPIDGSAPLPSHCAPVMHLEEADVVKVNEIMKSLMDELTGLKPGNFFLSMALFMEIIVSLARHEAIMTPEHQYRFVIGDVIAFMNRNLKRNIGIPELVTASKMSKRNLFRKFKLATGNTPVEYLLQLRLKKAAEMLLATNLTLGEIAMECGFCDSNYLCRMFRKHMNTTPGKFRKTK